MRRLLPKRPQDDGLHSQLVTAESSRRKRHQVSIACDSESSCYPMVNCEPLTLAYSLPETQDQGYYPSLIPTRHATRLLTAKQCDSRRPACSPCIQASTECHFAAAQEKSRHDSLEVRVRSINENDRHLRMILDLLYQSPREESNELLSRIREAPSVNDFVETFAGASLLIPQAPQGTS